MKNQKTNLFVRANEWLDKTFSPNGKKAFLVVIALLSFAGGFFLMSSSDTNNQKVDELDIVAESPSEGAPGDFDVEIESVDDVLVSIPIEELGRANPFLPESEAGIVARPTSMYGYALMAPPEHLQEGSDASKVVTTRVSGIMYDNLRPFAIINIEGSDYLVRIGDYIHNYKVLSITKDMVTVQLGSNTYKAGVGQLFRESAMLNTNQNAVYDLEHRFGGARR